MEIMLHQLVSLQWFHNWYSKSDITLFILWIFKHPHYPHHLPGKSWLISSISNTISYGTPASASSTLSWPGIRPATGWIPNLDKKQMNSWPYLIGQNVQRPVSPSNLYTLFLAPLLSPGTIWSLQVKVEFVQIDGQSTKLKLKIHGHSIHKL